MSYWCNAVHSCDPQRVCNRPAGHAGQHCNFRTDAVGNARNLWWGKNDPQAKIPDLQEQVLQQMKRNLTRSLERELFRSSHPCESVSIREAAF